MGGKDEGDSSPLLVHSFIFFIFLFLFYTRLLPLRLNKTMRAFSLIVAALAMAVGVSGEWDGEWAGRGMRGMDHRKAHAVTSDRVSSRKRERGGGAAGGPSPAARCHACLYARQGPSAPDGG